MRERILLILSIVWSCVFAESCITPLGKVSECVNVNDCPQFVSALSIKPLTDDIITFARQSKCKSDNKPKVCCGPFPSQQNSPTTVPPSITQPPNNAVEETDPVDPEDSFLAPRDQCGIDTQGDRIFGGVNTELDEFPWMALLGYLSPKGIMKYECGGSLLNHRYVMTAAHCLIGRIEVKVGKLKTVRLGEYDIRTNIDCKDGRCGDPVQEIQVLNKFPHAGYRDSSIHRENDIGLVRLAKRVKYSYFIQPVCLVERNARVIPGDQGVVAGWGKTLEGTRSNIKQKVNVPMFNKTECVTMYWRRHRINITEKQICAGGDFIKDSCKGDSGGPLMMRRQEGIYEELALVSFGYDCGRDGWPAVYTSVPAYIDWIKLTMQLINQ